MMTRVRICVCIKPYFHVQYAHSAAVGRSQVSTDEVFHSKLPTEFLQAYRFVKPLHFDSKGLPKVQILCYFIAF